MALGLHGNQLRRKVIPTRLGHGGQRIRGDTSPARDADINPFLTRFFTQVGLPWESRYRYFRGIR